MKPNASNPRRLTALLFCVLLLLQMSLPPVRAAERVYFTAVGSYVLPLSDNTMPFWSGGYVYVPSSIFTGTGRESLNVSQVLDSSLEWVVLYSGTGGRSLTFNLSSNCALDNNGTAYYPGAILRNGVMFVPANTVSRYFDLVYSVIEVERGSMVWLRPPSYNASDKLYANAAQYQLNTVYADYIRAKETVPPPKENTPAAPSRPSSGEADPAAELDGKRIALCLTAEDAATMADVLTVYDAGAAFFFTPEEMAEQGETLRRITAAGQNIGILADAADPERTVAEQLEAGNAALFQATCGKTRLARIENGGGQALQTAGELGFRCLQPDVVRSGQPLWTASGVSVLLQRLASHPGDAAVWLGDGVSPAGLRAFLSAVQEAGGACAAYYETFMG